MDINDYKKIKNKIYEDFKKKYPEEYKRQKEIEQKDLEKFFKDNFKKKVKVKGRLSSYRVASELCFIVVE